MLTTGCGSAWCGPATPITRTITTGPFRCGCSRQCSASTRNFISLQKDLRPDDRVILGERSDILDLTVHLTDYVETSALVSCLDLVITVDTSVAHLAGTLGRPTWILLPYMPDHRWLLDRHDSPWYPSVRLFRQGASRSYAEVIDRIRAELAAMVSEFRPAQG